MSRGGLGFEGIGAKYVTVQGSRFSKCCCFGFGAAFVKEKL